MALRTLAWKSKLDFGKHHGRTIQEIFDRVNGKSYLVWLYFNASHISFLPEIIEALGIDAKHLIKKPGKSAGTFDIHYRENEEHSFVRAKYKANYMVRQPKETLTKDALRSKNQKR